MLRSLHVSHQVCADAKGIDLVFLFIEGPQHILIDVVACDNIEIVELDPELGACLFACFS